MLQGKGNKMSDELQTTSKQQLQQPLSHPVPTEFNQYGDNSTQVGNVEHYHDTKAMIVMPGGSQRYGADAIDTAIQFDYSCYNLFVSDSGCYNGASFIVQKNKAMTETTPIDLRQKCAGLLPDGVATIKKFPAIFAEKNHHQKYTDTDHKAYFGYVLDAIVIECGIMVSFVSLSPVPQQLLNDNLSAFGLESAWAVNELDHIHWDIKRINLVEALNKVGCRVLSF